MKIIENSNEFNNLIAKDGLCVVDLFATWCGPCRMLAPILEQVAVKTEGKCTIAKVDVDELEDVAIAYGVNTIPTLLYFKAGKLLEKSVGLRSEEQILATIEKYI
ncbi:MAG: thioredoxin [Clostridia bacterium]|nr:thioredoxin [Clostridia bacterium]